MTFDRRVLGLLLVLGLLGSPAALMSALCVGESCRRSVSLRPAVPFCSLPSDVRAQMAAGFRDGRSPDFLAVAGRTAVRGGLGGSFVPWPSSGGEDGGRIPIVFWGSGVRNDAAVPAGTGLRDVAPTIADIAAFRRPHPNVRSGRPVDGVSSGSGPPRLILEVVWKGVGSGDLEAAADEWPFLDSLLRRGAGTLDGQVGFLPLDPAAALATLGTGGLPREHGITGTLVRDGDRVVRAWSPDAPFSVISTLPDDLDDGLAQRPRIGLVGIDPGERGIIGGNWYLRNDRDDVSFRSGEPNAQAAAASELLEDRYGKDDIPDLLAVVMRGRLAALDAGLRRLVRAATRLSGRSVLVVVTATGSESRRRSSFAASRLRGQVEDSLGPTLIDSLVVGGLFVDQAAVADTGTTDEQILGALRAVRTARGERVLADVFPGLAVSLARYC